MKKSILIIGGARSGKSTLAERKALQCCGRAIYIATARVQGGDSEMTDRIAAHKARRSDQAWDDREAPTDLVAALRETDGGVPRLVDCLTLWLTNLMLDGADWQAEVDMLIQTFSEQTAPVVFVSNEVGLGIVPENRLARTFRDAAGYLNQAVAEACDEVWLAVAGHPMRVKPNDTAF
ncbi:MAG: bifunctional adenosylcobinamide kinase/adenosylcobinamide-phosphate guanylyltransferase [Spiribacter salinus]|uniref:Bifunctional adenosylcobalamin biosynthesis protein n=1 Tax=Spiribacter salinus TaxID=1335746 RepID=A0A540VUE5_9GAMM|nr:MAG: bifunctional adenosylcobinamide kinase/adenosylcobinamide-phosphate guanylyltransferase [Spiribacter salinus]